MSHPEQFGFFSAVADANRSLIHGSSVLEIGSYDVNGTVRELFADAESYVGVDLTEGPGVDIVGFGHELDDADGTFDIAISGECFEHDANWIATFANMARLTRPGGLVAFTCASAGRPEHGTRRTLVSDSPGTQAEGLDYYRNLRQQDFDEALPLSEMFEDHRFWYMSTSFDLYFAGIRAGEPGRRARSSLPDDGSVMRLSSLMPRSHRVARLPLRLALSVLPEQQYQSVVRPYWALVQRLGASSRLARLQREGP